MQQKLQTLENVDATTPSSLKYKRVETSQVEGVKVEVQRQSDEKWCGKSKSATKRDANVTLQVPCLRLYGFKISLLEVIEGMCINSSSMRTSSNLITFVVKFCSLVNDPQPPESATPDS